MTSESAERLARFAELIAEFAASLVDSSTVPLASDPAPPVLLDVAEAARLLGVSRSSLYSGPIRRGELHTVLIGSRRLVPRSAVDAYVAGLARGAT